MLEPARDEATLRVLAIDDDHGKAVVSNMLLVVWKKLTTAQACKRLNEDIAELGRRQPAGLGLLQMLEIGAVPPDAQAREAIREFLKRCDTHVKHSAVVYEGTGFKAASIRAIVSGFYLSARPTFPHRVFCSVTTAAQWQASCEEQLARPDMTARRISDSVQTLRARVEKGV